MDEQRHIRRGGNITKREKYRMDNILGYIEKNLAADLSASVMAGEFKLSVSTIEHLFKKYYQKTYHKFVEEKRIRKAFELISADGRSVKEAIYATGYKNRTTFNAAFKRRYKHPPGYYRR